MKTFLFDYEYYKQNQENHKILKLIIEKISCKVYIYMQTMKEIRMSKQKKFVPRHRQIFDLLRERIRTRIWKYGEKLPSMEKLCKEFSVSPITMKTVLRNLRDEHMIRTVRGSGTYVSWKKENDYYANLETASSSNRHQVIHSLLSPSPAYEYMMNQLADTFMRNNPHISIRFVNIRPEDTADPYLLRIQNGDLPTCGEFYWHSLYAKQNALYPLEKLPDFPELQEELHRHAFYQTADEDQVPHVHALYIYLGIPSFLILNCDLLKQTGFKPPQTSVTWSQINRVVRAFAKSGQKAPFYATALNTPHSYHGVKSYIELMGQDLFNSTYQPDSIESFYDIFNTESALIGLEHLRKLQERGKLLRHRAHEYFALGDVGVLPFASSWTLNLIDMMSPSLNYFAYPHPPVGRNRLYRSFHSGFSVGIFRRGVKSETQLMAAWEWLRFFFHRRSQYLLSQTLKLPVRKGVTPYIQESRPFIDNLTKHLLVNSVPQPDFVGLRQVFTIVGQRIAFLLQGKSSPEKCLTEIKETLNCQR